MNNRGRYPSAKGSAKISEHPGFVDARRAEEIAESERAEKLAEAKAKAVDWAPDDLSEQESVVWVRVCAELILVGRYRPIFQDALAEYCSVLVRLKQFRKELNDEEWTYVTTGRHGMQQKARPMVAQVNVDHAKLMQLCAHFGLTPATELRYTANQQGDLFANEFDQL